MTLRPLDAARVLTVSPIALALVILGPGCRQLASIDDDPRPPSVLDAGDSGAHDGGGPASACGVALGSASCGACMAGACCAEAARCAGDPSCSAFRTCLAACAPDDAPCASTCRARVAGSDSASVAALASCQAAQCATACSVKCGGYVYGAGACATCGVANAACCAAGAACMANSECALLDVCEHACPASDAGPCLQVCELAHPTGVDASRAFGACLSKACTSTCIQPQWACLTRPAPPPTTTTNTGIELTYAFIDYETSKALPGLTVRLCARTDLDCTAPLSVAPVVTNVFGQATAKLGSNTFDGFAEVRGPGYPTVLVFLPRSTRSWIVPTLPVPRQTTFSTLAASFATQDPALGSLLTSARDCADTPAGGVSVALDSPGKSTRAYFVGGTPSRAASATDDDGFGAAAFVNVAPSVTLRVAATVAASQLTLPPMDVRVRAGTDTFTLAILFATPP